MEKIIYYVASSLDGYIATEQHKLDWLENFSLGNDATPYDNFYATIGSIIMGAETYNWLMSNSPDQWPYPDIPTFVITSRDLHIPEGANITLVTGSARAIAERARSASKERDIWLVGGGKTAAYFAESGELQQLFITTIPIFLGSGIKILPVPNQTHVTPKMQRLLKSGAMESIFEINKI